MALTNKRISGIEGSATLAMKAKAIELQSRGVKVIDLTTGEPEVNPPEHVFTAVETAMRAGKNKYTAVSGIEELRSALAQKLTAENSIATAAKDVIVTNGGKQAIYAALDCVLEPGDEVIFSAPYWVSYPAMVRLCGGVPVIVHTSEAAGYKVTPSDLAKALTPRTKMVIFNSPSNPTGATYSAADFRALGEVLQHHSCLILSDEVYERVCFGSFVSFAAACPELASRTITVNAFSKTYAMTGWRVGYATGPGEVIAAMGRHQSQTTSNVCSIAQNGALAALKGPMDTVVAMRARYLARMTTVKAMIDQMSGLSLARIPEGAFYIFLRADEMLKRLASRGVKDADQLGAEILDKTGVALVSGSAFGDPGALRLTVTASDTELNEAFTRIGEFAGKVYRG